jgi:hypothetical protein
MVKVMGTKVEVKTIPLHGLFIYRKQVWRSLGKLRAESHSTSAQKVYMNEYNTEVYTENADFIDGLKVTPYNGELPKISKYADCSMSHYQYCLNQKSI